MMRSIFCLALVFTSFFSPFFAQKDTSKRWFLVFSAREAALSPFSLAGHAFVSWGTSTTARPEISADLTYGFFPAADCGLLDELSDRKIGRVVRGWVENSNRQKVRLLVVPTDSLTWATTQLLVEKWRASTYNLLDKNCVKFMDNIAQAAHLRTPRTRMILGFPRRPTNYLKRLARKNKHKIIVKPEDFSENEVKSDELVLSKSDF